ncbi:hypothetical protein D3C76_1115920 [compost metagenome]
MVEVHARVEADQVVDLVGVVEIEVVLVPDVLELGGIQARGQVRYAAPGHAGPVQVTALAIIRQGAVEGVDAAVAALVVGLGEAGLAGFEHQACEAVVGQADAAEGLRQHARLTTGDHRVGQKQVASLEFGVEGLEFERGTGSRERIRGLARLAIALGVDRQDTGTGGARAAIEFQPQHGMGVQAEANRALGVA